MKNLDAEDNSNLNEEEKSEHTSADKTSEVPPSEPDKPPTAEITTVGEGAGSDSSAENATETAKLEEPAEEITKATESLKVKAAPAVASPQSATGGGGGSTLSKKWLAEKWLQENQSETSTASRKPVSGSKSGSALSKKPTTGNSLPAVAADDATKDGVDSGELKVSAETTSDMSFPEKVDSPTEDSIEAAQKELTAAVLDAIGSSEAASSISTKDLDAIGTPVGTGSSSTLNALKGSGKPYRQSDSSTALSKLSLSATHSNIKKSTVPEPERSAEEEAQIREENAVGRKKMKESSFAATGISTDNPDKITGAKKESKEVRVRRALQASGAWVSVGALIAIGVASYNQFQTSKSSKHLNNVEFALKNGMQTEALHELNDAIAADPDHHPDAYVNRATIYLSLKKFKEAADDFRRALEIDPTNVQALCGRGEAYLAMGNPNQSEADFKKAMKLAPKDAQPYRLRAHMYQSAHNYQKANADFVKALSLAGDKATAADFEAVGQAQYDAGHYAEAIKYFENAGKKEQRQSDVVRLGECYSKVGDSTKALAAYARAVLLDPTVATPYFESGKCYLAMKKYDQALDSFNDCLTKAPNNKEALLDRAICFMALKQNNHAMDDYDSYLKLDPKSVLVKKQRQLAYAKVTAAPKAIAGAVETPAAPAIAPAELKKLAEQVKTDEPAVVQVANAYAGSGNYDAAVSVLVLCVKANPSDVTARRLLAVSLFNQGHSAAAAGQFRDLSRVASLSDEERTKYVQALSQSGQVNEAVHVIMKMLADQPENDDLEILLVQTYANAGMPDKMQIAGRSALSKVKTQVARDKINEILNAGAQPAAPTMLDPTTRSVIKRKA